MELGKCWPNFITEDGPGVLGNKCTTARYATLQWRRQAWGTEARAPLEFANARKFCSRSKYGCTYLAQNRLLALK